MRSRPASPLLALVLTIVVVACEGGGGDTASPRPGGPATDDPVDNHTLKSFAGDPVFDPDYNRLTALPWVFPASSAETADVVVGPDSLRFPLASHADVLGWAPGRIVASAPDKAKGTKNPFGFARRVVSVENADPTVVVHTESVGLEEMFTGDFQLAINPDATTPIDLTNVDLAWASSSLYQDLDVFATPGSTLDDDLQSPDDLAVALAPAAFGHGNLSPQSWASFWNAVKKGAEAVGQALGGAAKAVAQAATDVWVAVTPESFSGSVNLSKNINVDYSSALFKASYSKAFRTKKQTAFELFIEGSGDMASTVTFNPGFQVGAKVPVPGHKAHTDLWMNVDSRLATKLTMKFAVAAGIRSIDGEPASLAEQHYRDAGNKGNDVLSAAREKLLGDPDMKPVGGWKRTIFISKPAYVTFEAGPIPVVLTSTVQVDVECGFEVKSHVDATLSLEQDGRFKYSVRYDGSNNTTTSSSPTFDNDKKANVEVTGGGSLAVSCGIIPRINVFAYDTIGIFAGVRGSLVAKASVDEQCSAKDPNATLPEATATAGLYANVGVQIGARVQAPGSSWAGKGGQKLGTDIGPFEPWNHEYALVSKSWPIPGIGFCLPECRNLAQDGSETDVDCGGACSTRCAPGRHCRKTTECQAGYCSGGRCGNDSCGTQVQDGRETDVDCGGTECQPCPAGKRCIAPSDCQTGYCAIDPPGGGSRSGNCAVDPCSDHVKDGDECGVDCGGSRCGTCASGAMCGDDSQCASGVSDGRFCVTDHCHDGVRDADEGGVDCGGAACRPCIAGMACGRDADCAASAPICNTTARVCVEPATCAALHAAVPNAPDGVYGLDVDGAGPLTPFPAYCDMTYAGGGWTRVGSELPGAAGAMALLGRETGSAAAIAKGSGSGLIGLRFAGRYTEVDVGYTSGGTTHHFRFTPSAEVFANTLANTLATEIPVTTYTSDDPAVGELYTMGGGATFCRASRYPDVLPGRTSWGIRPVIDASFACGCAGAMDEGAGIYYGGAAPGVATLCAGVGGGLSGVSGYGQPKGGITSYRTTIAVR